MLEVKPLSELKENLEVESALYKEAKKREQTEKFDEMLGYLLECFKKSAVTNGLDNASGWYSAYVLGDPRTVRLQEETNEMETLLSNHFFNMLNSFESALFLTYATEKLKDSGYSIAIRRVYTNVGYGTDCNRQYISHIFVVLTTTESIDSYLEEKPCMYTTYISFKCGEALRNFYLAGNWNTIRNNTLMSFEHDKDSVVFSNPNLYFAATKEEYDAKTKYKPSTKSSTDSAKPLKVLNDDWVSNIIVMGLLSIIIFLILSMFCS